jgi:hypothetical protein
MIERCGAIVELATKRCYTKARDSYFAMTVTDWFGGRGPNPNPNPNPNPPRCCPRCPNPDPNPDPDP